MNKKLSFTILFSVAMLCASLIYCCKYICNAYISTELLKAGKITLKK